MYERATDVREVVHAFSSVVAVIDGRSTAVPRGSTMLAGHWLPPPLLPLEAPTCLWAVQILFPPPTQFEVTEFAPTSDSPTTKSRGE